MKKRIVFCLIIGVYWLVMMGPVVGQHFRQPTSTLNAQIAPAKPVGSAQDKSISVPKAQCEVYYATSMNALGIAQRAKNSSSALQSRLFAESAANGIAYQNCMSRTR